MTMQAAETEAAWYSRIIIRVCDPWAIRCKGSIENKSVTFDPITTHGYKNFHLQ